MNSINLEAVNNDPERNVKVRVPPQDDGKKVEIIIENPTLDLEFERTVMNMYVTYEDGSLKTEFSPALQVEVGFNEEEEKLRLGYFDEKNNSYEWLTTDPTYGKVHRPLFPGKGVGYGHVELTSWGDPNVGWG